MISTPDKYKQWAKVNGAPVHFNDNGELDVACGSEFTPEQIEDINYMHFERSGSKEVQGNADFDFGQVKDDRLAQQTQAREKAEADKAETSKLLKGKLGSAVSKVFPKNRQMQVALAKEAKDRHKVKEAEAVQHWMIRNEIIGNFVKKTSRQENVGTSDTPEWKETGSTEHAYGGFVNSLRSMQHNGNRDAATMSGFDEMVDYAENHYPHILAGGGQGDKESALVDFLLKPKDEVYPPPVYSDEHIAETLAETGLDEMDSLPAPAPVSNEPWDGDESIPFSRSAAARRWLYAKFSRLKKFRYARQQRRLFDTAPTGPAPRTTPPVIGKRQPSLFDPKELVGAKGDGFNAPDGPQSGEMRVNQAGNVLVLRAGRWHRVDFIPEPVEGVQPKASAKQGGLFDNPKAPESVPRSTAKAEEDKGADKGYLTGDGEIQTSRRSRHVQPEPITLQGLPIRTDDVMVYTAPLSKKEIPFTVAAAWTELGPHGEVTRVMASALDPITGKRQWGIPSEGAGIQGVRRATAKDLETVDSAISKPATLEPDTPITVNDDSFNGEELYYVGPGEEPDTHEVRNDSGEYFTFHSSEIGELSGDAGNETRLGDVGLAGNGRGEADIQRGGVSAGATDGDLLSESRVAGGSPEDNPRMDSGEEEPTGAGGEVPSEPSQSELGEDGDGAWNPEQHVKISAESIDKLRSADVYRVLEWAPPERLQDMADYVNANRPDLADEVKDSLNDIREDRGDALDSDSEPQSTDTTPEQPIEAEVPAASPAAEEVEPEGAEDERVFPRQDKIDSLKERIEKNRPKWDREKTIPGAFVTGRSNRSASLNRQGDAENDRMADAFREHQQMESELKRLESIKEGWLAGEVYHDGQPRKDAPSRVKRRAAVEEFAGHFREVLKPGDEVALSANPRNRVTIQRVNPKSITTTSGSKWGYDEIIPSDEHKAAIRKRLEGEKETPAIASPEPTKEPNKPEAKALKNSSSRAGLLNLIINEDGKAKILAAPTSALGHMAETFHKKAPNIFKDRATARQAILDLRADNGVTEQERDPSKMAIALNSTTPTVDEVENALKHVKQEGSTFRTINPDTGEYHQFAYHENKNQAVSYFISQERKKFAASQGLDVSYGSRSFKHPKGNYRSWLKSHGTSENELLGIDKAAEKKALEEKLSNASMNLEGTQSLIDRLHNGEVTADELRQGYQKFQENRGTILEELKKLPKEELARYSPYHANENKSRLAEMALGSIRDSFNISEQAGQWMMGTDHWEKVKGDIAGLSDEHIQTHGATVKAAREEQAKEVAARHAAARKAYENPETIDEYRAFVRMRGENALTPEHRAAYDRLITDAGRERRKEERLKKAEVSAVDAGDVSFSKEQTTHTKTGKPVFVVRPSAYVDKSKYGEFRSAAQRLGGRWWNGNKGFNFGSESAADDFMRAMGGESIGGEDRLAQREASQTENRKGRLHGVADSIEERANSVLNADRKVNTARRASMAAGMEGSARKEIAKANSMRNIADAIERGEAEYLSGIGAGTHIDTLDQTLSRGRSDYASAQHKANPDMNYNERENMRSEPFSEQHINHVQYPYPAIHKDTVREVMEDAVNKPGMKLIANRYLKELKKIPEGQWQMKFDTGDKLNDLKKIRERADLGYGTKQSIDSSLENYNRLQKMDIRNGAELRTALREYLPLRGEQGAADPVQQAERALIGRKLEGFFPTPAPVIDQMLDYADIRDGQSVLEPSVGKGDIVDAVKSRHPDASVTGMEYNRELKNVLDAKGHEIEYGDFMGHQGQYDRIVMNPPFERGQDREHVQHAFNQLKPGGRMVAIMSSGPFHRTQKADEAFRQWLDSVGGEVHDLPEGSFAGNDSFRQTGVNTKMVVIDRD